jgi:hypothetical protein
MMQHTHRRRSSGAAGPISKAAFEATGTGGITATSDRFRQSVVLPESPVVYGFDVQSPDSGRYAPQLEVSGYGAGRDDAPEHNQ